ncbi:galactosylceramide sulfotransferase-like [Dreissena polymorpha]|uniref:Uncharacterized protein n=1 Tax=Dreissena polymorpha TaxID=45954 RepID=A0A9D4C274_DREPO|nr:galactosylceramide sulfotransferase-like [Dreissena polymorpha]XP_052248153.1 galactosylceramide sulfotransferase-like [Dreissena polymorpha]KAH3715825.1 hypothetical protein DPMN_058538 [Dreissena polymorpha]
MKWNIRWLLFAGGLVLILVTTVQFMHISKQLSLNKRDALIHQRTHTCPDILPLLGGVRIFSDEREVRHIAFLKVHKAASGTATSIFFRFGTERKLNFLRPTWLNIVSSSETIIDRQLRNPLDKPYDITTSHVIYNRKAFESYLHNDTVYIGIIREPYLQFKSSMNYMAPNYVYNISSEDPIQLYLKDPMKYEVAPNPRKSWINNRQAAEFGTPDDVIMKRNITAMSDYVKKLNKEFHLVIIAEYFDESIVLMKRLLNWKVSDILYRWFHTRGWDRKLTIPRAHDRRLYRKYAFADYAIYDFFYQKLWRQISNAGDDFFAEVLYFKEIREEMDDFCKVYPNITDTVTLRASEWSPEILVDKELCRKIYWEEEDWVKYINSDQYSYKTS